jgi:hypothetical protein
MPHWRKGNFGELYSLGNHRERLAIHIFPVDQSADSLMPIRISERVMPENSISDVFSPSI